MESLRNDLSSIAGHALSPEQKICDVNMRILNINAKYPGSTHDAFIWRHSAIRNALLANNQAGSWLIGDAAYPLEPWLMTPISNADEDSPSARYNDAHTWARNTIERCWPLKIKI
ncbi:hypothetical protein AVEN_134571-1 [Araneus ventricosus]|uniref:DDE Tnp4 domain-containing protein n=1 Tax=Araneus ventricosus TaxID=182803 RepID=A0A4Y2SLZ4_ARAVE|nr:hypothetical protein AVEN_134571-1 [Araneus ventricosus]